MKIRTQLIIRKMLQHYVHLLESKESGNKLHKWQGYFSTDELRCILKLRYGNELESKYLQKQATHAEMLDLIEDEIYLVQFILRKWEVTLSPHLSIPLDIESRTTALNQLQQEPHYLRDKPEKDLDEYDIANLHQIYRKAGFLKRVYAIYDKDVKAEEIDIVTTQPRVYYDMEHEVIAELDRMENEGICAVDSKKIFSKEIYLHPF